MKFKRKVTYAYRIPICLFCFAVLWACSTEIDINAAEEEIWVVYGVLNPTDSVQYVRISHGFLPEGNVLEAASDLSLSAKGLRVQIRNGAKTWTAIETDSILTDSAGLFYPYISLYKFNTQGVDQLVEGNTYTLEISDPGDDSFSLNAATRIPEAVQIRNPRLVPGPGQSQCLQAAALENTYEVQFLRASGRAFELRAFLNYTADGREKVATFGPTQLFEEDVSCSAGGDIVCYGIAAKDMLTTFRAQIEMEPANQYVYEVREENRCGEAESLPQAFQIEITSLDVDLANYIRANSPEFEDVNTVRPEYTNIQGSGLNFGVFGSFTPSIAIVGLSQCSEFLLKLNNTEAPASPCEF